MNFNSIGFFQLNNILQGRVPCLLAIYDKVDLAPWYDTVTKYHLEAISLNLEPEQGLDHIKNRGLPLGHSIIVIDKDGVKAEALVQQLEEAGFTNVFFVRGGYEKVKEESGK